MSKDGDSSDAGIPQGRVRRAAPMLGLAARAAGELAVSAAQRRAGGSGPADVHARAAERYAQSLGRSKGALMKAGQALSFVSLGPAISPELRSTYRSALARLRDDAPQMDADVARAVLESELGRSAEAVFSDFDWRPLSAASIGQVHRARLHDGREVAVKIQYPGVADAIRADLRNGELLSTFFAMVLGLMPRRMRLDPRAMAREVQSIIAAELDYRLEADRQALFAELYHGHPFIHVPGVITELSTARVLTQELVRGIPWVEAVVATQALRDRWGEAIVRFAYGSANHFRIYNADPHPGNYLFHPDGTVSFLDFGCVVPVSAQMSRTLAALVRACLSEDVMGLWRVVVGVGMWRDDDPVTAQEAFDYYRQQYRWCWAAQPFTITDGYVDALVRLRNSPTGPCGNAVRSLRSPPGFTILARMDTSVMSVLAGLRASGHWRSVMSEFFFGDPPATELGQLHHEFLASSPVAILRA